MDPARTPNTEQACGPGSAPDGGAAVFAALWEAISGVIGTGAAGLLVRRAAARAAPSAPRLAGLRIERAGLGYAYALPASWATPADPRGIEPLRALLEELGPLLAEMTGPVILRRLAAVPALRDAGLASDGDVNRWLAA